jgi:hypothetical protein
VVDPKPWLCPGSGRCPRVVGDTFVYRDESQVADPYAEALTPVLRQELRKLGMLGGYPWSSCSSAWYWLS